MQLYLTNIARTAYTVSFTSLLRCIAVEHEERIHWNGNTSHHQFYSTLQLNRPSRCGKHRIEDSTRFETQNCFSSLPQHPPLQQHHLIPSCSRFVSEIVMRFPAGALLLAIPQGCPTQSFEHCLPLHMRTHDNNMVFHLCSEKDPSGPSHHPIEVFLHKTLQHGERQLYDK